MRGSRIMGSLSLAIMALMAWACGASAATVTSNDPEYPATPQMLWTSTFLQFDGSFVANNCLHSSIHATIEDHGAGKPVSAGISSLTFSNCGYVMTVEEKGKLEAHAVSPTGNSTLTSIGAIWWMHTSVGACKFETGSGTHIGTLTGSNSVGKAVLDINSAKIPRTGGSFLCGSSATWTGSYTVVSPTSFEVH